MKKLYILTALCVLSAVSFTHAEGLQWDLPGGIGTIQLPTSGKDIIPLVGRDFVLNQTIAGVSASFLTIYREINGYGGVVGEFHSSTPNIQPYAALGADVAKYIPGLNQFKALQLHGFGRYAASQGGSFREHLGAGLSLAYLF